MILRRDRLPHRRDQSLERKGLRQKRELAVGRPAFLERVLGIAGHEDQLQIRIGPPHRARSYY